MRERVPIGVGRFCAEQQHGARMAREDCSTDAGAALAHRHYELLEREANRHRNLTARMALAMPLLDREKPNPEDSPVDNLVAVGASAL
jgi:hypothetical protein